MTKKNSGPEEAVKGVVEDVKGKAKEAVGTVTGRDDMVREGKAQQDKADAQMDAAKKEAEAESAPAGARPPKRQGQPGSGLAQADDPSRETGCRMILVRP